MIEIATGIVCGIGCMNLRLWLFSMHFMVARWWYESWKPGWLPLLAFLLFLPKAITYQLTDVE